MGKMRHKIITTGRHVRQVLYTGIFPTDTPKMREEKGRISTAARQKINDRRAYEKLKRTIFGNFDKQDLVVTLTYLDKYLPSSRKAARKHMQKFLRELRSIRKKRGYTLKYIYVIENKHDEGRYHFHLITNSTGADFEDIRTLWIYGDDIEFEKIDEYGIKDLAIYMTKEPRFKGRAEKGARMWSSSANLAREKAEPTVWVSGDFRLESPPNAYVVEADSHINEWGSLHYIEYLLPNPPKATRVRPRAKKKKIETT